jgi:ADP-heptose:LPS heptosyltransferase
MILISPWSRHTSEGKPSPKNYPYWVRVVQVLRARGLEVHQISVTGEPDIGATKRFDNLPFGEIERRIKECQAWCSVDTFFQHLAWSVEKRGVVIFGQSDPLIFGHPENVNLLLDRKHLREQQWWLWSQTPDKPEVFVPPEEVIAAILGLLKK